MASIFTGEKEAEEKELEELRRKQPLLFQAKKSPGFLTPVRQDENLGQVLGAQGESPMKSILAYAVPALVGALADKNPLKGAAGGALAAYMGRQIGKAKGGRVDNAQAFKQFDTDRRFGLMEGELLADQAHKAEQLAMQKARANSKGRGRGRGGPKKLKAYRLFDEELNRLKGIETALVSDPDSVSNAEVNYYKDHMKRLEGR